MKRKFVIIVGLILIVAIIILVISNINKDYDKSIIRILKKDGYSYSEKDNELLKNSDLSFDDYKEEVVSNKDSKYYNYNFNMKNYTLVKNEKEYIDGIEYDYDLTYYYKSSSLVFNYRIYDSKSNKTIIYAGSKKDSVSFEMQRTSQSGIDDEKLNESIKKYITSSAEEFYTEASKLIKSKKILKYIKEE